MHIRSIKFWEFRAFSDEEDGFEIELGTNITCIAGHNGVGKTTILAALSNCGELKGKDGRHLNGRMFRGDYGDLVKGDPKYDSTGHKVTVQFSTPHDEPTVETEVQFRATFQTRNKENERYREVDGDSGLYEKETYTTTLSRYRLIPKQTEARNHERKVVWPTYYLGLSRLYPVGESENVDRKPLKLDEEVQTELIDQYRKIFNYYADDFSAEILSLSDAPKKRGSGIETDKYGVLANSSGQDNLGQIILTVLSFRALKERQGSNYRGGLLLIDELDATLHPAAQLKLYDYLKKSSKELKLQVVFTTHSLHLLKHILKTGRLDPKNRSTRLLYLRNSRGSLEVLNNPSYERIQSDLNVEYLQGKVLKPTVPMLVEDQVAREVLEWLLNHKNSKVQGDFNSGSFSWQQICQLISSYWKYFHKSLVVLDPDVRSTENIEIARKHLGNTSFFFDGFDEPSNTHSRRIFFLPGKSPIETQMWNLFANCKPSDEFFFQSEVESLGVTKDSMVSRFLYDYEEAPKKLEFHKRWFETLVPKEIRPVMYLRWYEDNSEECDQLVEKLDAEFDKILEDGKFGGL